MASGEDWAPLPQRKCNKKNKDNQGKIFSQLMEMFGSTFEPDIVKSVAETCNWKLEQSIDALITLSSESQPTFNESSDSEVKEHKSTSGEKIATSCQPSNNAYLESQKLPYDPWAADDFPDAAIENDWAPPLEAKDPTKDSPKVETASLCGLKVEYRPRGMDANSDDDADVVIEESSGGSSRAVSPETVSVCQFLASPTQCPPRTTFPRTYCSSTPSPPLTPQRTPNGPRSGLARLEAEIREGYRVLALMRGAPGSGKSYLSRSILARTMPDARLADHVFSTDDFFVLVNRGVYIFDHARLPEAHEFNQNRVLNAMRNGLSPIIVDNTNTQVWEMQQYATMGVQHGYIIETVEPETPWARNVNELDKRNKHKVPKAKIRLMVERFEPNISGEQLIRMLRLKYSTDNQPPQLRKQPPLSVLRTSSPKKLTLSPQRRPRKPRKNDNPQKLIDNDALNTIANEYANMDDKIKMNPHDSWTEGISYKEDSFLDLMKLGAIGSERKAVTPKASDNGEVTKQERIEVDLKSQENEILNEIIQEVQEKLLLLDTDVTDKPEVNVESVNGEDHISCENNNNITSEIMEPVKIQATAIVGDTKGVKVEENVDQNDLKLTGTDTNNDEHDAFKPVVEKIGEFTETEKELISLSDKSSSHSSFEHTSDLDISQYEICNNSEVESDSSAHKKIRSSDDKQATGSLGSLFNFINSFLVTDKDKSLTSVTESLPSNNSSEETLIPAEKVDPQPETNVLDNSANSGETTDEYFEACEMDVTELVKEQLLEASSDFQLVEQHEQEERKVEKEESKICNIISDEAILEDIFKKFEFDLRKVSEELSKENILDDKNVFAEKVDRSLSSPGGVDNVNLISWRESPFPIDEVTTEKAQKNETESVKLETTEQGTNTHPYDFNVAYVGGTDEYKTLNAFNRDINSDQSSATGNNVIPQGKLMLHKGTMTTATSVLSDHTLFELELEAELEDRGNELVELFSQLPRHYVLDVYHNLCKRNLNWAVDYLTNIQSDDPTILAVIDQLDAPTTEQDQGTQTKETADLLTRTSSESSSSSNETGQQRSEQQQQQSRSSRKKKLPSPFELALQRQLQDKFVLSEESYKPHTLRVKRWKKRDFSPPQQQSQPQPAANINIVDTTLPSGHQFLPFTEFVPATTATEFKQPTRLDHPAVEEPTAEEEEEESFEDLVEEEETMELKLGYEFISMLEAEFGNSGFQVPDGLFPVIQIRRAMAQEIHALWIESMQRQLWVMHQQLDDNIAKDAEYARSLEAEEARALSDEEVPNIREVLDMEMALVKCSNKHEWKLEKSLREMFPEYDYAMLREIYEAHDRNFDETVEILKDNCVKKPTMADVLKKRNDLIDKLKEQRRENVENANQYEDEACGSGYDHDEYYLTYEEAVAQVQESRAEASRQYSLRNENYKKAAEACRLKRPAVAGYYSDVAKIHVQRMETANAKAAAAIVAAQLHNQDDDKLDLHKLRVVEASEVLDIFVDKKLHYMNKGERKTVYVITGRGIHSPAGYSRIKPMVAEKLSRKNIIFEEVNPGMLKVFLRKK